MYNVICKSQLRSWRGVDQQINAWMGVIMADMVGFYSLLPTPDGKGYLGALLVTDEIGKPEEFRVTHPVKPTLLQQQIYGDTLIPHVGVNLCGLPLFEALTNKPSLLLVSGEELLLLGRDVSCPVAYVERFGETLTIAADGSDHTPSNRPVASQSGRFQPLAPTYPSHYSREERRNTGVLINRFFEQIDLVEPFDRIEKAITALAEQDQRFR